jgi:hypothetical protein
MPEKRRWTTEQLQYMKELRESGASYQEIGDEFKISNAYVNDIFRRYWPEVHKATKTNRGEEKPIILPEPIYRDYTSLLMGDPPIGRSALDGQGGSAQCGPENAP